MKDKIEQLLVRNGFCLGEATTQNEYNKNSYYTNCYGTKSRSPFVINHPVYGQTRIECRSQQTGGTTDQKFPYLLECAKGMPEATVIFIIEGNGFKPCALDFLRRGARAISSKTVMVMSVTEFTNWLNTKKKAA